MADDAMFKLEHGEGDKDKAKDQAPRLNRLVGIRQERWKDDYSTNCALRAAFRVR
jgi:coiled-coil domain-containing protein 130